MECCSEVWDAGVPAVGQTKKRGRERRHVMRCNKLATIYLQLNLFPTTYMEKCLQMQSMSMMIYGECAGAERYSENFVIAMSWEGLQLFGRFPSLKIYEVQL